MSILTLCSQCVIDFNRWLTNNGHYLYSFGDINLYLPFPKPLTGSIKPTFFSFVMRLPAAVTESFVIAAMSERPNTPSTPILANTAFTFSIVPWLAFSRSRVDMMKCPYHDICAEYGCPELCRCFCDSDDISYAGLHPKLIWERTMTLGRGDDRCDFCMKIIK